MDSLKKKAIMLLKSLIFHFHGIDEDERKLLIKAAKKIDAEEEMDWANKFIAEDYLSAFERSRGFFTKIFLKMKPADRIQHLKDVWEENYAKGYVTEMETTAIFTLAKDWKIEDEFLNIVND